MCQLSSQPEKGTFSLPLPFVLLSRDGVRFIHTGEGICFPESIDSHADVIWKHSDRST